MASALSSTATRFKQMLEDRGYFFDVVELPGSTRTAKDAAAAVGCTVSQIAKSLVFRGGESSEAILAIVSGSNRADTRKLAVLCGESVDKADANFVRAETGFVIGGVPPTGHPKSLRTFIDSDLLKFEDVWAAAGTPRAVFRLPSSQLTELTGGHVKDVKEQASCTHQP